MIQKINPLPTLWASFCLLLCLSAAPVWAEIPHYDMVRIRVGTFMMGSPETEPLSREDEQMHQVTLTRDFFMGRYEVTQAFYQAIMDTNPSYNNVCPECPVEMISWQDAIIFCNALSKKSGLMPVYRKQDSKMVMDLNAPGYRLPTEAEGEYACRAGTRTIFPNGNCLSANEANINGYIAQSGCSESLNRAQTIPVGSFAPNGWGLYDMTGNINEFCWDWYEYYTADDQVDPLGGPPATYRVFRGGAFNNFPARSHSASRQKLEPERALDMVGVRLVRTAVSSAEVRP